eukprot:symbB.v1.2.019221.t1/scaffold1565.1/size111341/8
MTRPWIRQGKTLACSLTCSRVAMERFVAQRRFRQTLDGRLGLSYTLLTHFHTDSSWPMAGTPSGALSAAGRTLVAGTGGSNLRKESFTLKEGEQSVVLLKEKLRELEEQLEGTLRPKMRQCNEDASSSRQRPSAAWAKHVPKQHKRWVRFKDKPSSAVRFDEKADWPRCQRMLVDEGFIASVLFYDSKQLEEVPSVPACVAQNLGFSPPSPGVAPKARPSLRRSATVPVNRPPLDETSVLRASEPCVPLLTWVQELIKEHNERIKLSAELTQANATKAQAESEEAEAEADLAEAEALLARLREALATQETMLEQLTADKNAAEKALQDIKRLDSLGTPAPVKSPKKAKKTEPQEKVPVPIELEISGTLAVFEQKFLFFSPTAMVRYLRGSAVLLFSSILTCFVGIQKESLHMLRGNILRHGWADKDWNWGSPFGTAHDEAMALRERLDTQEQREAWATRLKSGEVDIEELKLALGLRIQHAARAGMDGDGVGWTLMQDMAACKYEGSDGQKLLKEDLDRLILTISGKDSSLAQCGVPFKRADAQVLEGDPQQALILPRIADIMKEHRGKLKLQLEGHQAEGEEPGTDLERSLAVYQWLVEVAGCAPGLLRLKGCGSTAGLGQLVIPVPIQELVFRSGPKPAEMENFPSGLYFAKDSIDLLPETIELLAPLGKAFADENYAVRLEGHVDKDENPDLAGQRAARVRELLMELGVPRTKMRPQSCKALHPLSRTKHAVNRRVELHIL